MKAVRHLLALVALALAATTASAQFVKGNEAVKVMPDGTKKVETPPTAGALLAKPCPAATPGCSGGGWKMVETPEGLMECTEVFAEDLKGDLRPDTRQHVVEPVRDRLAHIDIRRQHSKARADLGNDLLAAAL